MCAVLLEKHGKVRNHDENPTLKETKSKQANLTLTCPWKITHISDIS